ncbi:MAG TPA: PQQ-binding-like beta-propeller repeat protein [Pirellulales bacterium]|nr:PQQ-binding-like beta-propeller repeat protein [Pirellulales bacterium]
MRRLLCGWVLCGLGLFSLTFVAPAWGQVAPGGLVPETMAARHGLTRAWFAQTEINAQFSRLRAISLHYGTLFAVSDQAHVQAFDAETGKSLWSLTVGNLKYPTTGVGANATTAAVCNGTTLYLFDRASGRALDERDLGGVPTAEPAVSDDSIYVPLSKGLIEIQKIQRDPNRAAAVAGSAGQTFKSPLVTYDSVVWGSDAGYVFSISNANNASRFQAETFGAVMGGLSYRPPYVFAGSLGGYVYAFHEANGKVLWRFTAGDPVREMPVVLGDAVYVVPETGGIFRVKAATGLEQWHTPFVKHFLSASKTRVYCTDAVDRFTILDAANGARIDTLPLTGYSLKLENQLNDRIYLADGKGLIQCFHEPELKEPLMYVPPKPVKAAVVVPAKTKPAKEAKAPADAADAKPDAMKANKPEAMKADKPAPAKGAPPVDPFK